ncbi:MAG: hypothetical protein GXP43_03120 [bacterium]|nr:hypothetical protein [bacterium]
MPKTKTTTPEKDQAKTTDKKDHTQPTKQQTNKSKTQPTSSPTPEQNPPTKEKKPKAENKPKSTKPHPKAMHKKRSKKYLQTAGLVDKHKTYSPKEAVKLVKKVSYAGFDASVDLHINTTKTGKIAEIKLPHAAGKTKKIAIVDDNILKQIEAGKIDFDILITHPQYMPKLAKFARILGPKGLMPNPKNGTISPEPEKVKAKLEKGTHLVIKTEPKAPIAHVSIGRVSFSEKQLLDNLTTILKALKPSDVKSIYLAPTMGPSIKIQFPI